MPLSALFCVNQRPICFDHRKLVRSVFNSGKIFPLRGDSSILPDFRKNATNLKFRGIRGGLALPLPAMTCHHLSEFAVLMSYLRFSASISGQLVLITVNQRDQCSSAVCLKTRA